MLKLHLKTSSSTIDNEDVWITWRIKSGIFYPFTFLVLSRGDGETHSFCLRVSGRSIQIFKSSGVTGRGAEGKRGKIRGTRRGN